MIYLSSPYTHTDPYIMEQRVAEAQRCVAWLIHAGYPVHSPIVHCHRMAQIYSMHNESEHWKDYNEAFIRASTEVWFALFEGWKDSAGMRREYSYAIKQDRTIKIVEDIRGAYNISVPLRFIY